MFETTFSKTAQKFAEQLVGMSLRDIADVIDRRVAVDIGLERGTTIRHHLIYSVANDRYFVAVRDARSCSIVTIKTLEKSAWGPTNQQRELALANALAQRDTCAGQNSFDEVRVPKQWPVFRIAMTLADGSRFRIVLPGKWNVSAGFKALFSDTEFVQTLMPRIDEILNSGGSIKGFSLKANGGDFVAAEDRHVAMLRKVVAEQRSEHQSGVDISNDWYER